MTQLVGPFAGLLVTPAWASRVVSPLQDRRVSEAGEVVGPAELQRLVDLGAYESAPPATYIYRLVESGRSHTAVVAEVAVEGFVDARVLGHEAVQPARVDALVRHFDQVPQRSEMVSLVHREAVALAPLDAVVAQTVTRPALVELEDATGVAQTVWRLDAAGSALAQRLLDSTRLYIADGHHRVAASLQRWERDGRPVHSTVLCAVLPERDLDLLAFHRRVRGPVDNTALLADLARRFDVEPASGPTQQRGAIGLYVEGRWHRLVFEPTTAVAGVSGLDVTVLAQEVLGPLLGVGLGDPRLELVPETVPLSTSVSACAVDGGVLFTLRGPTVDDLVGVAERGEVMAAKSTFVQPKPRAGVFVS